MHPNDIPVLAKIFNPNTKYIFIPQSGFPNGSITDALNCHLFFYESPLFIKEVLEKYPAKHCTVINPLPDHFFSKEITTIQVEPPSHPVTSRHWMNFAQSINSSSDRKSLYEKAYHYINNPDDTIRWLYPAIQKQPTFLHLYNASGWKGKLIKKGIEVGFRWGLEERIKQGTIQVYAPYALVGGVLQKASTLFKPTDFAIFTGTKGENRKAVIVFEKNKRATHFLKAPLTAAAENLVKNEGDQLKQLANYSFDTLVVPQAKRIHQHLLQTNIRPTTFRPNLNLTTTHLQALWELYQETVEWKLLEQTTAWTTLEDNLSKLKITKIQNDLSPSTIQQIIYRLKEVKSQIDTTLPISVALAHGDFTPWNSYLTTNKVMVYDWELATTLPLLYDAFHFIFQTSILVKRHSFPTIKKQIEKLQQQQIVQELINQYNISFEDAYRFYLSHTVSYYLNRYIRQPHLHEQVHWLIATWHEALNELVIRKEKHKGKTLF